MLDIVHVIAPGRAVASSGCLCPRSTARRARRRTSTSRRPASKAALGRVACEIMGTLVAPTRRCSASTSRNTGLGVAIGAEGEGGHILLRPLCESKICPLSEIVLSNMQLNDKAGAKLLSSLSQGLANKNSGYEKITSLCLANNELGSQRPSAQGGAVGRARAVRAQVPRPAQQRRIAGHDIALAIRRNESLTSLDIRNIPSANTDSVFTSIGSLLLQDECECRLGLLSCDAFQVSSPVKRS